MSPAHFILPPSPGSGALGLKTRGRLSSGPWPGAAGCSHAQGVGSCRCHYLHLVVGIYGIMVLWHVVVLVGFINCL